MNIIQACEDPKLFGQLFKDPRTWASWFVFLKAVFGLKMERGELATWRKCTSRHNPSGQPFKEVFCIVGRRGGKSFTSSLLAVYLACFVDWRKHLSHGERAWVFLIATDKLQARVLLNYIKGILQLPMLREMVEKTLTWEVVLKNQISIEIKTSDWRSIRGFTVVAAICDELAFWRDLSAANPAGEILTALRPALATVPGSMLLGISTPYAKAGPLFEMWRDKFGQDDPDVLVWRAATKEMNPTISQKIIDKAWREDPSAARAEWGAEFRVDIETYLLSEKISAAIIPERTFQPPVFSIPYFGFADPSGGRNDSFTLAISHRASGGQIVLDRLEEICPPFKPLEAVSKFSAILKQYRVEEIQGDHYAGEWVVSGFRDQGIDFKPSAKPKSEIYLDFEVLVNQGQVELLDSQRLFSQLRGLERRTRSGGKDLIDHSPGLHDDLANAAAGACVLAKGEGGDGYFICQLKSGPLDTGSRDTISQWMDQKFSRKQ